MNKAIETLLEDLDNFELPSDFDVACEKIRGELDAGKKIYWYYSGDKEFFENEGLDIKDYRNEMFSGFIVPNIGVQAHRELEIDDIVVVVCSYPTEKEYPETFWVALKRLIDDERLVEIFT